MIIHENSGNSTKNNFTFNRFCCIIQSLVLNKGKIMNRRMSNSTRAATQRRNFIFHSVRKMKERERQCENYQPR